MAAPPACQHAIAAYAARFIIVSDYAIPSRPATKLRMASSTFFEPTVGELKEWKKQLRIH